MVPIDSETRLPSTMVEGVRRPRGPRPIDVPAMVLPTTLPTAPIAKANSMDATATITAESVLAPTTRRRLET